MSNYQLLYYYCFRRLTKIFSDELKDGNRPCNLLTNLVQGTKAPVPECTPKGYFIARQCGLYKCFCVTPSGGKIPNTDHNKYDNLNCAKLGTLATASNAKLI